jgi:IS605 OrfB family transposase
MMVAKTLKLKVENPTRTKFDLLEQEYLKLDFFLKTGIDLGLYSANKQQALRFYKKIKPEKEYPLSIRNDLIKISENKKFVRIPVKGRRGGVWLPVKGYEEIPSDCKILESKIKKKNGYFIILLTIQKEITLKTSYSSILAIDLGERVIATAVLSSNQRPIFYGREIRGIRRHYSWLRKRLGERKLLKKIKQLGNKEKRIVDYHLHKISKAIVSLSHQTNSLIVLGDLKGIRKFVKGKRMNRIVSNMPYYKLTKYIEYKANWQGIKVIKINEKGTSHICSRCGSEGKRVKQGLFVCKNCGYKVNADYNGAKNILKRFEDYMSSNGVVVEPTLNCSQTTETPFDRWE